MKCSKILLYLYINSIILGEYVSIEICYKTTIVNNKNLHLYFDLFNKVFYDSVHAKSVTAHLYATVEISIIIVVPFSSYNNSKYFTFILQ